MAASSRSAALAYRIGSPRHDSRYSAIDMSVSLRASKDRANALNRESLYMISLLIRSMLETLLGSRAAEAPPLLAANQRQHMAQLDTSRTAPAMHIVCSR